MNALVSLFGAEPECPHIEARLVEPQPKIFDLGLKVGGGDGPIAPAAQVSLASARPHWNAPRRRSRKFSHSDLGPDVLRHVHVHTLPGPFYVRNFGSSIGPSHDSWGVRCWWGRRPGTLGKSHERAGDPTGCRGAAATLRSTSYGTSMGEPTDLRPRTQNHRRRRAHHTRSTGSRCWGQPTHGHSSQDRPTALPPGSSSGSATGFLSA
jgi:hypothetical protein